MTVEQFCSSGNREIFKGGVHGAACVIAALMAAYNIAAFCFRRERHLGTNALVYTLAVGWEVTQTWHHLRKNPERALLSSTQSDPQAPATATSSRDEAPDDSDNESDTTGSVRACELGGL